MLAPYAAVILVDITFLIIGVLNVSTFVLSSIPLSRGAVAYIAFYVVISWYWFTNLIQDLALLSNYKKSQHNS